MTEAPATVRTRAAAASGVLSRPVRGRWVVAGAIYAYFLLVVGNGGHAHWGDFWIPLMTPAFADLLSLTSAWECTRDGIDPLRLNPCDPFERPANYPRLWLALAPLGLGANATTALGLLTAGAFFAAALSLVPRRTPLWTAGAWAAAATSPAVMLGVERGNPDLLLFVLLVLVVHTFRLRRAGRAVSVALLVLAAMLKLFPAFALGVLVRQRARRALVTLAVAVSVFGAYALATRDDIRAILDVIPKSVEFSFGAQVGLHAVRLGLESGDDRVWRALLLLALAAAIATAAMLAWSRGSRVVPPVGISARRRARALDAFWIGALVYAGSFATAFNWDYRLMFLLFTIPQLARAAADRDPTLPAAGWALAAVVGTLWLSEWLIFHRLDPFEEILNWLLFVYFVAALLLTLPQWLATWVRAATDRPRPARP